VSVQIYRENADNWTVSSRRGKAPAGDRLLHPGLLRFGAAGTAAFGVWLVIGGDDSGTGLGVFLLFCCALEISAAPYVGAVRRLSERSREAENEHERKAAQAAFRRERSVRLVPPAFAALACTALALALWSHARDQSPLMQAFYVMFAGWALLGVIAVTVLRALATRAERRGDGDDQ
jgi:hypothetical protein